MSTLDIMFLQLNNFPQNKPIITLVNVTLITASDWKNNQHQNTAKPQVPLYNAISIYYRGFARQPCCMAGTMKIFCIRKNLFSLGKKNLLFLPCNMAAMQNLYNSQLDFIKVFMSRSSNAKPYDLINTNPFKPTCGQIVLGDLTSYQGSREFLV